MRTRKAWWAAALAGLLGCGGGAAARAPETAEPPPRPVRTAVVDSRGGAGSQAAGAILARQRATLAARLPAAVVALPYRAGDRVPAGAVVVRLDDGALRSAAAAAESAAAAAEADRARVEHLVERKAATEREADEARARAAGARASVQASREALAYAVLRAPFAGVVAEQPVHVGDVVAPGAPLIVIEGEGGFEVVASLSRAQAAALRVKGVVQVEVDGIPQPLSAVVRVLSPAGDAATHRFELRADLPAAPGVRSGLFARVAVPGAEAAEERLVVPASAVLDRGGLSGLYVVSDGRARLRWVALGSRAGDVVEVRAGAEAGERVVLEPAGLADGARVSER